MKLHANHRLSEQSSPDLRSRARRGMDAPAGDRPPRPACARRPSGWLATGRVIIYCWIVRRGRGARRGSLPPIACETIERLRGVRITPAEIAGVLELPLYTVSLCLKRIGP